MQLGVHRFTIAWERVLPTGDSKNPNKLGVDYYHDYIKEVKKNGMEPAVRHIHFVNVPGVSDFTGQSNELPTALPGLGLGN